GKLIDLIWHRPSLTFKDLRVFRIVNILMLLAVFFMLVVCCVLLYLSLTVPFWLCVVETLAFITLLVYHIKGYFFTTRYIFFLIAIGMQVYGSLNHGENGGFDFFFFAAAFTPVLFFEKRVHYLSLFILSVSTFIAVKVLYNHVEPILPFDRQIYPYYANIVISAVLVYIATSFFKREHLKYENQITLQKNKILSQKRTLDQTKKNLLELLEDKDRRLEQRDKSMDKYAYLNSHKARSPLARILGLAHLTNLDDLSDQEKRTYYFGEIMQNAQDLDNVLQEISAILDRDLEE
ncbi:MAG: hypothetical protein AAGA02_05470, partial [Bacteroidota bacterium]